MRISEATILRDAFENSFAFMINRISEHGLVVSANFSQGDIEVLSDRCWNEFSLALEEMGVTLEEAKVGR